MVRLSRGVVVSPQAVGATLDGLARLAAHRPVALHELVTHARDAGYRLGRASARVIAAVGIAVFDGEVANDARAIVADAARGFGFAIAIVDPRTGRRVRPGGAPLARVMGEVAPPVGASARPTTAKLVDMATALGARGRRITEAEMRTWAAVAASLRDARGRALPALRRTLGAVEARLGTDMSTGARLVFQDLAADAGVPLASKHAMPMRRRAYWGKEAHPLHGFRSRPTLPERADVVVVGGGWVGASAALRLAERGGRRGRIVVVEEGEVAGQASGRNGGNLEGIPENFVGAYGTYDGYLEERFKFLRRSYPELDEDVLRRQAERITHAVLRFGFENARMVLDTVKRHDLAVDLSTAGWLRLAENEREERALAREVTLARALGADIHVIRPETIKERYGLDAAFAGRITYGNGNFHPFKLVVGCMQKAIEIGAELYTGTKVLSVASRSHGDHLVETSRGSVRARKVIVATNAFTSRLFPQLRDIRFFQTQVSNYNHARNPLRGITFTAKDGDIYSNFPKQDWYVDPDGQKRGTLHLGGGKDTPGKDPYRARPYASIVRLSQREAGEIFPDIARQPPVRVAAGPMAFVEGKHGMRMATIGTLAPSGPASGVAVGVWCNGYGTTGCMKTGYELAEWAENGEFSADVPDDVFGLQRILQDDPLFDPVRAGPPRSGRRKRT